MRSPEELDDVDWTGRDQGWAIPPLIRMLYADHPAFDRDGFEELESHVYNAGVVGREATVLAVPFLAHAALHSEFFPDRALSLLARFVDIGIYPRGIELEVRDAVATEAPELLPCLEFADPRLRQFALQVLGGCAFSLGADKARVTAAVLHVFENDFDRDVTADALTALLLLENKADLLPHVEQALASADPVLRLSGLLCALEARYVRDVTEMAEFVDEAGGLAAKYPDDHFGFPFVGTRADRAHRSFQALQAAYRDGA
jgi:hypothetical protein